MSKEQHNQLSQLFLSQILLLAGLFITLVNCQVKVILTATFPPMVECTIGDDSRSSFSGLDIQMFDRIAAKIDTSAYIGFFGGQTIDSAREQEGYVFSYPMWNTGISIILYDNLDFWFQVSVLTWQISLSLVGTALGIGVLQFFFEKREQSLEQFLWNSMTSMFFITTINLKRNASRLLQICFWFIVLIIGSTYIARATNLLTIDRPLYQIKTPYDLNHRRVITYSLYKYDLFQYGAVPLTSDFGPNPSVFDEISTDLMITYLSRDDDYRVDGFVVDDIQAQISERMHCNLFIAGRSFYQFSYGIAFYKTQQQTLIQQINSAILTITLEQSSEALISSYIQKKYPACDKGAKNDAITMDHVGGLYVIQGIVLGCGLFIYIVTKIPLYRRLSRKLVSLNIQSAEAKEDEKELQGDELVAANIKQAAKEQITAFQAQIEDRLDEMDENIIKFYEILLNEDQLKKNKIIVDFDMHPAPPSQSRRHEESLQQSQYMMYTAHTKEDEPILANNNKNNNNDIGDFNNNSNRKITNSKYIYKESNYLSIPIAKDNTNSNNINLSNCSSNPNNMPNSNQFKDTSIELRKETELIDFGETEVTSEIQDENEITPGSTAEKKEENIGDRSNISVNKSLDKQQVYSDSEEPPNHQKPRAEMNVSQ